MEYAILAAVGLLTGVLGGMLGVGGSSIMLPAMVVILGTHLNGLEQTHQYMAVAMIVNFLLSVPSVLAHWKNKAIWPSFVKYLMVGGLCGVLVGVWASQFVNGQYLRWFLGFFFVYVAAENLLRAWRGSKSNRASRHHVEKTSWLPKLSLGTGVGLFAGMTGLGGGALAVPAQQYIFNIPIRNAIANSSALIASMAWLGAITKNVQLVHHPEMGTVVRSLIIAAFLAPPAMIGSYAGGHLTHSLPLRFVRAAFGLMILAATYKMFEGFLPALRAMVGA
ncbi:MAG: sulfite exporter TauE/SafE family protein [Phycisphaerae bacterium]